MRVRVITGVILSIFFASLVWVQGWYFRIVTMIATCFCMFELYDAFRKKGMKPIQWLCVAYPAALLGVEGGRLSVGCAADVVVFDPDKEIVVDASRFLSRGKNTPFDGKRYFGEIELTLVGGKTAYQA